MMLPPLKGADVDPRNMCSSSLLSSQAQANAALESVPAPLASSLNMRTPHARDIRPTYGVPPQRNIDLSSQLPGLALERCQHQGTGEVKGREQRDEGENAAPGDVDGQQ
jgi:hypothetical protein